MPSTPKAGAIDNVMSSLPEVLVDVVPGGTVTLLLTRPGRGPASNLDRDWAALLWSMADAYGVPLEPIFRANDEAIVEVRPSLKRAG